MRFLLALLLCASPAFGQTIQQAVDAAGQYGHVQVPDGTYSAGANLNYYRLVTITGNCADPTKVVVNTNDGLIFSAQDHAILTVSCLTLAGANAIGLFARQFAIIDYNRVIFGAMKMHVSAAENSRINCQSARIVGNAIYHAAASGHSTISLACPITIDPGVTVDAFAYAVRSSIIDASGDAIKGNVSGYAYINDASQIYQPKHGFPGNGGICQNGCLMW